MKKPRIFCDTSIVTINKIKICFKHKKFNELHQILIFEMWNDHTLKFRANDKNNYIQRYIIKNYLQGLAYIIKRWFYQW